MKDKAAFLEAVKTDEEVAAGEAVQLQIETGIYLRYWESDAILKDYFQLARLACGEDYEWGFELPNTRTPSRSKIIRNEIRDKLERVSPAFYHLIKECYITQARNAIAHSQFYLMHRCIWFLNHSSDTLHHCPLQGMGFDAWYRIFHLTVLLHNEYIRASLQTKEEYLKKTILNGNSIEIRVPRRDGSKSTINLGYGPTQKAWLFEAQLTPEDRAFRG